VVGSSVTTLIYRAKAEIDGNRYAALIQPVPGGQERIVGRDVLNQSLTRAAADRSASCPEKWSTH
jgi:predicted aspartyl protease